MSPVTWLRLYEPAAAIAGPSGAEPPVQVVDYDEFLRVSAAHARARVALTPPRPVPARESSVALELAGPTGRCVWPWQERLLSWHALDTLEESVSAPVLDEMVPPAARREVHAAREAWLAAGGDARVRTRLATWEVPLAWFALFPAPDDGTGEREEVLVSHGERGESGPFGGFGRGSGRPRERPVTGVRRRTPAAAAAIRADWALTRARAALPDADLTDDLVSLVAWLGQFDDASVLELDYGALGAVVHPDETVSDLRTGLESLAAGDTALAAACHERISRRWLPVRQAARAS